jgi:hypothetical protein
MPGNSDDAGLHHWLVWLLTGGGAHAKFDDVVKDLPAGLRGKKPRGLPYSAWQLLEHLRITQADIVSFSTDPNYREREWPAGYWPESAAPPDEEAWERSVRSFRADLRTMVRLIEDPKSDLSAKFPWGSGQNLLREALLLADHNAYHLGQLVLLRRLLGAWPE